MAGRHYLQALFLFLSSVPLPMLRKPLRYLCHASHYGAALQPAEVEALSVALLDVNLRGEQSFAIADILMGRGVPFVFMTGYDQSILPERFKASPMLQKPCPAWMLARAFAAAMGQPPVLI